MKENLDGNLMYTIKYGKSCLPKIEKTKVLEDILPLIKFSEASRCPICKDNGCIPSGDIYTSHNLLATKALGECGCRLLAVRCLAYGKPFLLLHEVLHHHFNSETVGKGKSEVKK